MAIDPKRGTKAEKAKKMSPKEKKMNKTVNDAALGKSKKKRDKK